MEKTPRSNRGILIAILLVLIVWFIVWRQGQVEDNLQQWEQDRYVTCVVEGGIYC